MTSSQTRKIKVRRGLGKNLAPKFLGGLKILITLVLLGLFLSQFVLAGELSTRGGELAELAESLEKLKIENQLLENRSAERSSLSLIRERAEKELGMTASEFEFLTPAQLAQLTQ